MSVRSIDVTDGNLVKVTLGNGSNNTVLAKKINICIFDDAPNTVAFNFPGLDDPMSTGIMEHNENPTEHYYANGVARKFNNLTSDTGEYDDTPSCSELMLLLVAKLMPGQTQSQYFFIDTPDQM